tara:strand:+ start:146 stop:559 length:414 start_codon:yes stop_codon:yes gene_type:complete
MTTTSPETREQLMEEEYVFPCKDINDTFNKDAKWIIKNALRELNQKRIKNYQPIKNFKKRFRKENKKYTCPVCETECQFLTCAHIGATQSGIIDEVQLQAAEDGNNLEKLYDILRERHNVVNIAVCCIKCNKEMENI